MAGLDECLLLCTLIPTILIIIFGIPESACADDVVASCPEKFQNDQTYEILCKLDSAGISSLGCLNGATSLTFEFTSSSGSFHSSCSSDYPCDLSAGTGSACKCVSNNGGIYTYSYTFVAKEDTHKGGSMKCTVDCIKPSRNLTYTTNGSCDNFQFDPPQPASREKCNTGCEIALGIVIPICVLAMAAIGVHYFLKWKKKKKSEENTQNAMEGENASAAMHNTRKNETENK